MRGCDDPALGLRRLVERRLVAPLFQPIVDLRRGMASGYEVLCRPAAESGFFSAGELFDSAAQTGMLWPVEHLARDVALSAAGLWSPDTMLFLNCSPRVVADQRFPDEILRAVRAVPGLAPARIVLEVTERSTHQQVLGLEAQSRVLHELGFQIAMDDVGAGSSGLARLTKIRPDWVKLDRELVADIDRDAIRRNLVKLLASFSQSSGMRVVAEGIERADELQVLIDLDVPFAQGFFLGRPEPSPEPLREDAAALLASVQIERGPAAEPTHRKRLREFARPVFTAEVTETASEVGARLLRQPDVPGLVALDEGRPVGWCSRDRLLAAVRSRGGTIPLHLLATVTMVPLSADTTIADALAALGAFESGMGPILLGDEFGAVIGLVLIADLLREAGSLLGHTLESPGRAPAGPTAA